jgi:hypothetical protein
MKRVGIYLRVSTDNQTTENLRELEAVAQRSGWHVVGIYEDAGISGARRQGTRQAPGLGSPAEGRNVAQARHDRSLVGRPAWAKLAGSGRLPH